MWTQNIGVVSSIPSCVTFKTPLVKKAMGDHLMNSTSLEKIQSPVSGFCYDRNRVCSALSFKRALRESKRLRNHLKTDENEFRSFWD